MVKSLKVISNGKVVTPNGMVDEDVIIRDGKVEQVTSSSESLGHQARNIDAAGGYVLPGLIDLHVHGAGGSNLRDDDASSVDKVRQSLADFGTTCFLATAQISGEDNQKETRKIVESVGNRGKGAEVAGIHLEGPFINPARRGMICPKYVQECSLARWEAVWRQCNGTLRMMTIAPELPNATDVIRDMVQKDVTAALGHTDATLNEVRAGFEAGVRHVTHLANAMRGLHHREPGALGGVLMNDTVTMQIIADGHHLHPEFVDWVVSMKGPECCCLITDGIGAMGLSTDSCEYEDYQCTIQDGAAYNADGHLVGTTLTQLQMVQRAMGFTGLPIHEVVNMASLYPARVLSIDDSKGSIEPGKDADLVVCDAEMEVRDVLIGGRLWTDT